MNSPWRTVQIFLSPRCAVYEAQINQSSGVVRCNCPAYSSRGACTHERFVKSRAMTNGGTYPVQVTGRTPERFRPDSKSAEEFRDFVLKYGRIEVL